MTFVAEPNPGSLDFRLSPTSQRMLELQHEVLEQWSERVRSDIEPATALKQPILINTLPVFYDNLARAITPSYPRADAIAGTTVAIEHGGERARLTNYNPQAIVAEYQLLKSVLLDVMERHDVSFDHAQLQVITTSIEGAIRQSVTAYVVAVAALREQIVSALMHDFRSPVGVVSMAAELITRTTSLAQAQASAKTILANTKRMDKMLRELLDGLTFEGGSRLSLELSSFDMLALAQEVAEQFEAQHGPRFKVSGATVQVLWSREDVKRALENLLGNAVKYGEQTTSIAISLEHIDGRLIVSVHNVGNPIPLSETEDAFQMFARAQAAKEGGKEGWGIGLAFVRKVAESHGGSCAVDSSLERGTTFYIDMPVDARPFQNARILG
ncbi:HAMP domain-containing sensor histidine kinase [Polaromonas sp. CG_23.6]|uniref:sensor histidine kinase n=1 Tax=Polaromonas sp. CG_23.6 TaxID=2760709 RepID=UPI002474B3A9|nr:HAMP domain-containing sensor histidine kinase [Polaromonas sp. CG_23.6]MDH6186949.1 signal transduction histidine kinase [Polaromonas sp. CG_23.6]